MFQLAEINRLDRVKEACSVGMVPSHPESLDESWDGNCVLISLLNYWIKPTMKHNQVLDFHLKYWIHPLHCINNLKSNFLSVLAGTAIPFGSCRRESQSSGSNAHETFTTKSCPEEHCEWKEVSILHYSLAHWNPWTMCMWGTCYPLGIFWLWDSLSNSSHPLQLISSPCLIPISTNLELPPSVTFEPVEWKHREMGGQLGMQGQAILSIQDWDIQWILRRVGNRWQCAARPWLLTWGWHHRCY